MTSVRRRKGQPKLAPDIANLVFGALDYSTDGIAIGSVDGTIYYHNKAWIDIHNWAKTFDARGRNIKIVERKELKPVLHEVFKGLNARGHFSGTFGITRPDGLYHDLLINAQVIKRFEPPIVVAIIRDVTELMQVKRALERRGDELAVLNEIHRVMQCARDRKTVVRKMLRLLGDFIGAASAGIYEVDRALECSQLIDCYGLPEHIRRRIERVPRTDSAFKRIQASKRAMVMEEDLPGHRGGRCDIRKALGYDRVVSLAFRTEARRDYQIIFGLKKGSDLGAGVRRFLETAANQFGIALDRVEMIEKLGEREREIARRADELEVFAKLHNSMVASDKRSVVVRKMFEIIRDFVGATGLAMYRIDPKSEHAELVHCIGLAKGVARSVERVSMRGTAFSAMTRAKHVFVIEEEMPGYRGGSVDIRRRVGVKTTVGFMFRTGGKMDFLLVLGFRKEKRVTPELRRFFDNVGRHFAIAVERLDFLETLGAREAELQNLNARLIEAGEEHRRRCAMQIHDEFGQALTGLGLELAAMERNFHGSNPRAQEIFAGARERIRSIAGSMRTFSQSLHPALLDELGLLPTLEWYIGEWQRASGIDVQFSFAGFDRQPPRAVAVALYRVVQECLTNIRKHSGAARVKITLAKGHPYAILHCEDNGRGFSLIGGTSGKKGLGLVSMRERVESLGGSFQIESSPGKGTRIRVKIPLGARHAQ